MYNSDRSGGLDCREIPSWRNGLMAAWSTMSHRQPGPAVNTEGCIEPLAVECET